jgi:hypothetical protein
VVTRTAYLGLGMNRSKHQRRSCCLFMERREGIFEILSHFAIPES